MNQRCYKEQRKSVKLMNMDIIIKILIVILVINAGSFTASSQREIMRE
jgi:hypothetical protein